MREDHLWQILDHLVNNLVLLIYCSTVSWSTKIEQKYEICWQIIFFLGLDKSMVKSIYSNSGK